MNDQGKAFFFFDESQIEEMKQVDITFCDCDMSPSLITGMMDFINQLTDFLDTNDFDRLVEKLLQNGEFSETELSQMGLQASDLATKTVTKEIKHQIITYIKKKLIKRLVMLLVKQF